jgi:hypothetical protein
MNISTQKVFEFFRAFDGLRPDGVVDQDELYQGTAYLADLKREGYTELDDIGALSRTFLPKEDGGAGLSPDGLVDGYSDGVIDPEEILELAGMDGNPDDISEEDFAIMKERTGLSGSDEYNDYDDCEEGELELPEARNQFLNYQPAESDTLPQTYSI